MNVTIKLPPALAQLVNHSSHAVQGSTVLEALKDFEKKCPGLMDRIVTEQNEMRPHVLLFVDETEIRLLAGLKTKLKDGQTLHILPSVSGG